MSNYFPTLEQVRGFVGQGNLCPVYRTINADLETPVSAYLKAVSYTHLTLPTKA